MQNPQNFKNIGDRECIRAVLTQQENFEEKMKGVLYSKNEVVFLVSSTREELSIRRRHVLKI